MQPTNRSLTTRTLIATLLLLGGLCACTAPRSADPAEPDRMDWWREARFGLFIHWGLYAIPAGEWEGGTNHAEWIRTTARIPRETYEDFLAWFDPVKFDANEWARLAKEAGMRYVVITSKHHDGFCLFDSAQTEWDVMSTPFQRDILAELAEACRRHGLAMCWYHSIMDWHHPDYLPRRGWEEWSPEGADFDRYLAHLHAQVEELLTRYGPIGVMWFDGEWERTWSHEYGLELYDLCRRLQPDVIVNNRVDVGRGGMAGMTVAGEYAGDFGTPEQEIPPTGLPGVDWETCMTMNRHWGYNKNDHDWKSTEDLIRKLVDIASKGGNFLLNVGPTAAGEFPPESVERLRGIGRWMEVNGEAIHGTGASPFAELPFGRCTLRQEGEDATLYLHVFDWPEDGLLVVPGIGNDPVGARLLAEPGRELSVTRRGGDLRVALPAAPPDPICSVVELEIEGRPVVYETPRIRAVGEIHPESPVRYLVDRRSVEMSTASDQLVIRYTLDGSEPTRSSPRYRGPFQLSRTAVVRARSFHRGEPVSGIAEARFEKVDPRPAQAVSGLRPGLLCERYEGDWDELPDLDELEPSASWTASEVGLGDEAQGEYCALRLSGWLDVPRDDVYQLALASDDGSRLFVGDRLVIDNDGLHGVAEEIGAAPLAAGLHPIRVEWFNKTGGAELKLAWAAAGEELRPIPAARLKRR